MTAVSMLLLLALAEPTLQVPARPVPPSAAVDANSKATALIKGRITAADTGRPLRRARVTLQGPPLPTPRSTSTNIRGEYELKDLPSGRYQIRVQRSGYLPMQYGQRRSTEPPKPLEVGEGQVFEKLDFALPRTGLVSGRVIDETGEPVAAVRVWAMRQEYFRGRRRLVPAGPEATTDDTGQYRVLNVPPGEYVFMALLRETWMQGPDRQPFGYAPTFFPGTARAADATRVKVATGQEIPNTDFALVAARAGTISGTATAADGSPLAGSRVSLSLELMGSNGGIAMGITSAAVAADGSWRMPDIPPGEYQLEVSSLDRDRPPARAFEVVQVQAGDVEGVTLVTDYGGTITGQVVTDSGEALPASASRLRVAAESVAPDHRALGFMMGDDNGLVSSDGRFTFTGALGPSAIRVMSLPRGWSVKSIEGGDRDFAEAPVELRAGQTLDLRIVLTNRFPAVSGRITDDRGNPVEGTVVLFPSDAAKWFDATLVRVSRPDQSGLFRMETVRPGEYLAVALDSLLSWQAADPEFLEDLRGRAARFTVREGQPEVLTLKVAR